MNTETDIDPVERLLRMESELVTLRAALGPERLPSQHDASTAARELGHEVERLARLAHAREGLLLG
jgi:hypothetical protein